MIIKTEVVEAIEGFQVLINIGNQQFRLEVEETINEAAFMKGCLDRALENVLPKTPPV